MKTPATRMLEEHGVRYIEHVYEYVEHGGTAVSGGEEARIAPCRPEAAQRHTGYLVGGTSPFGLRKPLPVCVERSILELPQIYINGGRRGFLVRIASAELSRVLAPTPVSVALED